MKAIKFIFEKTSTGFSAYAEDEKYPVGTTGKNMTELKVNTLEATNLYLNHNKKKAVTAEDIIIELDLAQFFDYYKIINAKALSERIGMNQSLLVSGRPTTYLPARLIS